MNSGYYPVKPPSMRRTTWHLFRGTVSLCAAHEITDLPLDKLEPELVADANRRYCQHCQDLLGMEARKGWPAEPALSLTEKDFIREHWEAHSAKELAAMLGRTVHQKISQWASTYCVRKNRNTGQFRKGGIPPTAKPGVNETVRFDKRQVPYWHVRGGKWGWQYKHVALWEAAHGPVPKGKIVVFKDKDTLNCVLENLELLTRSEHLGRNSGRDELTDSYVAKVLARTTGKQGAHFNREVERLMLENPEMLELKRNQLRLSRAIKAVSKP